MASRTARSILIAGAGIGGLATALALQRAGFRPILFEAAPTLGEVGAGLTIPSNGSRIIEYLGLGHLFDGPACIPRRGAVLHYRDGRQMMSTPRGQNIIERYGAPYLQIHRADLHGALLGAVRAQDPDCIRADHALVDVEQAGDEVIARFAGGRRANGDLLIGCDGIRSIVRERLFGVAAPRFAGFVAWRGLVPMDRLTPGLVDPDSAVWLGPGRYLLRYCIRGGALLNYVAVTRTGEWAEESWSVPSKVETVQHVFREFEPRAREIIAATSPDDCFRWGIFDRDPLVRWSLGRVTLLGDAAHPMTPFLGQGAVMALEDAVVLSRTLADSATISEALERYENARRDRTAFVLAESRRRGEQMTGRSPESYSGATHRNEDTLDLGAYDAMTVPV